MKSKVFLPTEILVEHGSFRRDPKDAGVVRSTVERNKFCFLYLMHVLLCLVCRKATPNSVSTYTLFGYAKEVILMSQCFVSEAKVRFIVPQKDTIITRCKQTCCMDQVMHWPQEKSDYNGGRLMDVSKTGPWIPGQSTSAQTDIAYPSMLIARMEYRRGNSNSQIGSFLRSVQLRPFIPLY